MEFNLCANNGKLFSMDLILGALLASHMPHRIEITNLITASDPTYATAHVANPLHIYCAPSLFVPTNKQDVTNIRHVHINRIGMQ